MALLPNVWSLKSARRPVYASHQCVTRAIRFQLDDICVNTKLTVHCRTVLVQR